MKALAAFLITLAIASPTFAGVIWDESVNGELSHSAALPTLLPLAVGSNIIIGTIGNPGGLARDYVRFIIAEGHELTAMNLLVYTPDNIGFAAINGGVHSYFPSLETNGFYMAGIHISSADVGSDMLDLFMNRSVTAESLGTPTLAEPGNYSMVIQQTAIVINTYSIEFVLEGPVSTEQTTWGKVKALYR